MKTAVLQDMTSCSLVDRYPEDSSRIFPSMVDTHVQGTRRHVPEDGNLRSNDLETLKFQRD
jgi:hypothetical protein